MESKVCKTSGAKVQRLSGNFSEKILDNKKLDQIALLGTKFQLSINAHVFYLLRGIFRQIKSRKLTKFSVGSSLSRILLHFKLQGNRYQVIITNIFV